MPESSIKRDINYPLRIKPENKRILDKLKQDDISYNQAINEAIACMSKYYRHAKRWHSTTTGF